MEIVSILIHEHICINATYEHVYLRQLHIQWLDELVLDEKVYNLAFVTRKMDVTGNE